MTEEIKNIITQAKNICLIPVQNNEPESLTAALALFYTLKELNKNVNLIADAFPEKLHFLMPSTDFLSQPKNFVISIPRSVADISQIYYEKSDDSLKIHLTIDNGIIKKENIAFYFTNVKPDLVITVGISDFQKELAGKLDSFGFLLDAPIVNIDSAQENTKFGKINIIEQKSISEIALDTIKSLGQTSINKNTANCILAGLVMHYDNLKSPKTTAETFALASELIKKGAEHNQIIDNIYKASNQEIQFIEAIFKNIRHQDNAASVALLNTQDFNNFSEQEAQVAVEKIKTIGFQNDLLVLWPSKNSPSIIKGFFYSKKPNIINKFAQDPQSHIKQGWVFVQMQGEDMGMAKDHVEKLLS